MTRTSYRPSLLVAGIAAGLLVSGSACALMSTAAPVAKADDAIVAQLAARPAAGISAPAPLHRDPFVPLVNLSE